MLESWPQTYVQVRNVCAHRARLWNVSLGVYPPIPELTCGLAIGGDGRSARAVKTRLYPVLVSLQSVLDSVSTHSSWALRLHERLNTRPQMNLAGMGVPEGWPTTSGSG